MSKPTVISTGSSTLVKASGGTLYSIHVTPAAGGSVILADTPAAGFGAGGPDFNSNTFTEPWRLRYGPYAGTSDVQISFAGTQFSSGLTVAASSSSRVAVFTD